MSDDETTDVDALETVVPSGPRPGLAFSDAPSQPRSDEGLARPSDLVDLREASTRTEPLRVSMRPSVAGSSTGGSSRSTSQLRSEAQMVIASTLDEEEVVRARGFAAIIAFVSGFAAVSFLVLGGDPLVRRLAQVAVASICAVSIFVFRSIRATGKYTVRMGRAYGVFLAIGVFFVEYHVGLFSAVPGILTLGVLFLGQSADRRGALAISVFLIVTWSLAATLVGFEVIPDRSLFPATDAPLASRVFVLLAITAILALTLRMARLSRASLNDAVKNSQEALLLAHERDVQLEEARQNLDRALRAVVGRNGRYTGASAGRYRLEEVIGVGAMGEVYAATSESPGESVAVKLMQAETAQHDDLVERFLREGEICRKLRGENVVRVLDVGRMIDGSPYLAMERLYGDDLAALLRDKGHLGLDEASTLAAEMAAGLDEAHALGIVHRDLKPQNLFHAELRDGRRVWKILDFGVSKLLGSGGTLTRADVVGTPGYMSPEQARGVAVDARSDVFSMAVVLYRVLTGQPAFGVPGVPEKLFQIVFHMPEAPTKVRRELPPEIDLVFAIALAKDPERRFDSAGAFAKAFAQAAKGELSRHVRERGSASVARMPWGSTLTAPAR